MSIIKYYSVFLILFCTVFNLQAQKQELITKESEIIAKAQKELEIAANSGSIKSSIAELGIKGSYTFDITIYRKGEVLTVFAPFEVTENIKQQNAVKDLVKAFRLSFKMPKDKRYKFRYTFDFN